MDLELNGKVAIVTGGSKGIGRAIVLRLALEGAHVVVGARGRAEADDTARAAVAAGGTAVAATLDVTRPEDIARVVGDAVERFGGLDILVNNAGSQRRRAGFDDLTDQDFLDAYDDNVLSAVRMIRACLPHMRARGGGAIVNIGSEVAVQPDRVFQHYSAAKAALLNLGKSLSKALARDTILVNTVSPGLIMTAGVERSFNTAAETQQRSIEEVIGDFTRKFKPGLALNRCGTPEEVADVVAFLASPRASYITGANYQVNGGSVVGI